MIDIRKSLKKILPYLSKAQEDNLNEADTVLRLVKFFEDVLGYDPMTEISREKQVKDKYVDLAIKIDGVVRLLIEAKSAGSTLRDRHIEQAERYASLDNIPWVLLTNGIVWNLYHLTFDEGIDYQKVFSIELSTQMLDTAAETLTLLHRQSVKKGLLEEHWNKHTALNAESLGKAIFNYDALKIIRRDIRRREGIVLDEEEIAQKIHELLSVEAREKIGPLKIRRKYKQKVKTEAPIAKKPETQIPPSDFSQPEIPTN
jgi:predicted type IV restriction endonuclease